MGKTVTSSSITAGAGAVAVGETISYTKLTSFLQKDTSFLTPWTWDPKASENEVSSSRKEKEILQFQPGSYFFVSIFDLLNAKKNSRENDYHLLAREYQKLRNCSCNTSSNKEITNQYEPSDNENALPRIFFISQDT
ncbi:hypothetical protein CR513_18078, partial [Mucuna pruriens]